MFCPTCGKENPDNAKICGYCGKELQGAAPIVPKEAIDEEKTVVLGVPSESGSEDQLRMDDAMVLIPPEAPEEEPENPPEKAENKKGLIITIICLGSALLIAAVFLILFALGVFKGEEEEKKTGTNLDKYISDISQAGESIVAPSEVIIVNSGNNIETVSPESEFYESSVEEESSEPSFESSSEDVISSTATIEVVSHELLQLNETDGSWANITDFEAGVFSNALWEPGAYEKRIFQIKNTGNVVVDWKAQLLSSTPDSILGDVMNVYLCVGATNVKDLQDNSKYVKIGTLSELANKDLTSGYLRLNSSEYIGVMLEMSETATQEHAAAEPMDMEFNIEITKR